MASLFKPKTIATAKLAKLPRHQHPALLAQQFKKPMEVQRMEIEGQVPFEAGQYHNTRYQALVKALKQTRKSYRQAPSLDVRFQIATNQSSLWEKYINEGVDGLPEDKRVDETKRNQLYQAYIITKQRTEDKVSCHRLLHFHNQYARAFKWDIEFHPRVLLQLTHPHFGYLVNFNKKITLQELINLYDRMLFASQERYLGQTLHADEIVAYNFWRFFTSEPHLKLSDFCQFLKAFKFQTSPQTFYKHFSYTLNNSKGEFNQNAKTDQPIRFDLFRNIFLDRGL